MLISYAQNFEDIILWRVFKNIKSGFYIDIGAWCPSKDSVTRCFYDAGWHGINIEPNPFYYHKLRRERIRDINLKVAVSDTEGEGEMVFIKGSGLSTLDQTLIDSYQDEGLELKQQKVVLRSLPSIWSEYVAAHQEVHFLKIDIEGLEATVIKAHDWKRFRPWVVVVEATLPMSQIPSHDDWEHLLLTHDYDLVYRDGLNRFYLAREHADLKKSFEYPPNVFDHFLRANEAELLEKNKKLQKEQKHIKTALGTAQSQLDEMTIQCGHANEQLNRLQADLQEKKNAMDTQSILLKNKDNEITALRNSTSWRITSPLRWLSEKVNLQNIRKKHHIGRLAVQKISFFVMRHPKLMIPCRIVFNRFPKVKVFLHQLIIGRPLGQDFHSQPQDINALKRDFSLAELNFRGREIYHDLTQKLDGKGAL